MNRKGITIPGMICLILTILITESLFLDPGVFAAENSTSNTSPFSFELGAGLDYDSNITVVEIDTTSGQSDVAATLEAAASFDTELGSATDLRIGYSFSENFHQEFSEFDIQTHLITADLIHDFGNFEAGIAYRFADASLDGDGFLSLGQVSPYLSVYFNDQLMVRAEYLYSDKSFDNRSERDSDVNRIGADLYYFFDGVRSYFVLGYRHEEEDAKAAQFDFSSNSMRIRYFYRFSLGSLTARLRLSGDYEDRRYDAVTPSIGKKRDDSRLNLGAELEFPLSESLSLEIGYVYNDNSSRLPVADYDQNLLSAQLLWNF